jgi:hypothetical protein
MESVVEILSRSVIPTAVLSVWFNAVLAAILLACPPGFGSGQVLPLFACTLAVTGVVTCGRHGLVRGLIGAAVSPCVSFVRSGTLMCIPLWACDAVLRIWHGTPPFDADRCYHDALLAVGWGPCLGVLGAVWAAREAPHAPANVGTVVTQMKKRSLSWGVVGLGAGALLSEAIQGLDPWWQEAWWRPCLGRLCWLSPHATLAAAELACVSVTLRRRRPR